MNNFYDLTYQTSGGEDLSLRNFEGKVLLIVNTATECGLTPQMHGLSQLYDRYQSKGLEILAFPSNDFAGQEPRGNDEIASYCELEFRSRFPFASKVHVKKGPDQHAVYQWLSNKKLNGKSPFAPFWNFQKYLISRDGCLLNYFLPITRPQSKRLLRAIESAL